CALPIYSSESLAGDSEGAARVVNIASLLRTYLRFGLGLVFGHRIDIPFYFSKLILLGLVPQGEIEIFSVLLELKDKVHVLILIFFVDFFKSLKNFFFIIVYIYPKLIAFFIVPGETVIKRQGPFFVGIIAGLLRKDMLLFPVVEGDPLLNKPKTFRKY